MDFAVCPACGQSVLDDDATECPFCGSSMKAQPGSKPSAPTKSPGPAASKPAAKPKHADKSSGEDLPFDTSANIPTSVIQAARQSGKGRTLQVTCPMCETEGYVPPSAAGKDIKCANPKCLVPVFTAPLPEPEPVAPSKPVKKAGNPVLLGLITLVVMLGVGAGAYLYSNRPTNEVFVKPIDVSSVPVNANSNDTPQTTTPLDTPKVAPETPETIAAKATANDLQLVQEILKDCQQTSLLSGSRNRSKPYCRRLAAEAYALSGDMNGARQQIDALSKVGPELKFYQVTPWVEIFWQERAAKKNEAATQALNAAVQAAVTLPNRGRDQLDVATQLAVALVISDRIDEARALISAHQTTDLDGEVSPEFLWLTADPRLVSTEAVFGLRPMVARQAPQAAAVAALSVLRGDAAQGLKYAQSWPDSNTRAECLSAWAEGVVWLKGPEAQALIEPAVADLQPAAQALVYARAARIAAAHQQPKLGLALLSKGTGALESLAIPAAVIVPKTSDLVKTRPNFDPVWQHAAKAASELAVAQWQVAGDKALAATWLNRALDYARGLGPSLPAIRVLIANADRLGPTGLRNRLKTELELRTDDEARQSMGLYRRGLTDYETGAQQRMALQVMILNRTTQAGMEEAVWTIASTQHGLEDDAAREEFLATDVAMWLGEQFRLKGQADTLSALTAARGRYGLNELPRATARVFLELMAANQPAEAWKSVTQTGVKPDLRESLVLQSAVQLGVTDVPLDQAWKAVAPIADVVLREQAIEWLSLMAARRGKAAEVWKHRQDVTSATEILSLSKGTVQGIEDRRNAAEPPQPAPAAAAASGQQ